MRLKYSTTNLMVSLYAALAERFRAEGYDIYWHATREREERTDGSATARGTITLVPEFPANPASIIGHTTTGTPEDHEIVVPAFTVLLPGSPAKLKRTGLGESEFFRERQVFIAGFVRDSFEHRYLADVLYDWLEGTHAQLRIFDHEADAESPPEVGKVDVQRLRVDRPEFATGDEAIRYHIRARMTVRYVE